MHDSDIPAPVRWVLFAILAPPWILYNYVYGRFRRLAWKRRKEAPKFLPKSRQRALSLPLPPPASLLSRRPKQRTSDQSQSLFFGLPKELRFMIYGQLIGSEDVHVVAMHGRLGSFECGDKAHVWSGNVPCNCWDGHWHKIVRATRFDIWCGVPGLRTYSRIGLHTLPLLKTCRMLYSELIDTFYRSRVFTFRNIDAIPFLPLCILAKRMDAITSIRIDGRFMHFAENYSYPVSSISSAVSYARANLPNDCLYEVGGIRTWAVACSVLSKMNGLRRLWVHLSLDAFRLELMDENGNVGNEELVFGPMQWIRGVEIFEVEVDWEMSESFDAIAERPYRLTRRETWKR